MTVLLHARTGPTRRLALDAWHAPASAAEREVLHRLDGPVLDLGCGPGRLVVALAEHGIAALGVDASPAAARRAAESGAPVLCRSLYERLPGEGRWQTALLFDGNIGIGGDPAGLLRRVATLLTARGSLLVEVGPPGSITDITEARVETPDHLGPWFPWAWVAADRLASFATEAGLAFDGWLRPDGRWIARLRVAPR